MPETEYKYNFQNITEQSIFLDSNGNPIPPSKFRISVMVLYKGSDKEFLVGSEDGLFTLNNGTFRLVDIGIENEVKIVSLLKDRKNNFFNRII
ncbi:MAG: hypothetical protein HC906_11070 [Bacteroidales bacterium]|nr:hypothetical protein [Bacteroidales bacterium]